MSILESKNSNLSIQKSFWISTNASNSRIISVPIIHQDKLYLKLANSSVEVHDFYLTSNHLYYRHLNLIIKSKITWCLLESFYEPDSESLNYGFSLINSQDKHDFFASDAESLENWLRHLSSICIMTNIDEDFVKIKDIDSGRYGQVYLCQDITNATEFAVKKIAKESINNSAQVDHLRYEIKILRKIDHPCCIKLYRVYEDDSYLYLLMEYVHHGNLLERLRKIRSFSEAEVASLIKTLIEVVLYLHNLRIIHRDIKLENILMCSNYNNTEFKLADFGLATYIDKVKKTRCGSPGFMAPEMLSGGFYDLKADIYSIGVLAFTLLTGNLPFQSNSVKNILDKNSKGDIKFEKKTWKNFSAAAFNFVSSLLNKDPKARPSAEKAIFHPWICSEFVKSNSGMVTVLISNAEDVRQREVKIKKVFRFARKNILLKEYLHKGHLKLKGVDNIA